MLIEQHEASNQLNHHRIDASPENSAITQTGRRNATQAPTLAEGSQSLCARKRLTGDPGIFLTSVVQECARESSFNRTVSSSDIGLSDTEILESFNMAIVDKIDDTGAHDKLFLTMANVEHTRFLSSSMHFAGLLLVYSKIMSLDSTHDLHSHIDAGHMTRIRDRYARLDSTYPMNQPHDAARALKMILQSNSGRSERACTIHSKCQCHPTVPGREELYFMFPLTSNQCLWDLATSESTACLECSQQDFQSLRISHNLQAIIFEVLVDISQCQFGSLMPAPNDIITVDGDELVGFTLRGAITYVTLNMSRPGHYVTRLQHTRGDAIWSNCATGDQRSTIPTLSTHLQTPVLLYQRTNRRYVNMYSAE